MNSIRLVTRRCLHQYRQLHRCAVVHQSEIATTATGPIEPLTIPPPEGTEKPVSAKIDKIAKEITALNLIEVAELSDLLKKRLNLPDAPVMPIGGFATVQKQQEEEEVQPRQVQTAYTVKLVKFDEKQKVPLIKEIKSIMPDMNLVQAKKFVESAPIVVMADISKDEAEKLKEAISKVGGEVEIS